MNQPDKETTDTKRTKETNSAPRPPALGALMIVRLFIPLFLITATAITFLAGWMVGVQAMMVESQGESLMIKAALMHKKSESVRKRLAVRHAVQTALVARAKGLRPDQKTSVADIVLRYSDEHGHDPFLLLAVIETESSYRPKVVSNKGAVGLMQIRPFVGRGLSSELLGDAIDDDALYDPKVNIQLGAYYLAKLLKKFDGNLEMALEGYNRGPYRLMRHLRKSNGAKIAMPYTKKVFEARENIRKSLEDFGLTVL